MDLRLVKSPGKIVKYTLDITHEICYYIFVMKIYWYWKNSKKRGIDAARHRDSAISDT